MIKYTENFTIEEQDWLQHRQLITDDIFEEIDDISNVNSLQDGEPDGEPGRVAIHATRLMIEASLLNWLRGPYHEPHYLLILKYFPQLQTSQHIFWKQFSYGCASKKEEGEFSAERIYVSAVAELVLLVDRENYVFEDEEGMYDTERNAEETIGGVGVNAYFC